MGCKGKSDTNNNKGNWDRFKIIRKIPQIHKGKNEIKELKNTAILGTAHTAEITAVRVQNVSHGK